MVDNEKSTNDSDDKIDITFKDEETRKRPNVRKSSPEKARKKAKKAQPKGTAEQKEEGSTALLVIIIILIIAAGGYLIYTNYPAANNSPEGNSADFVAKVNGDIITEEDLNSVYAQLSPQIKMFFDKPAVLARLIDQKLLLQEAEERGIVVTEEEINESLELLHSSLPPELSMDAFLETQNLTREQLKVDIKKQMQITKVLNETVMSKIKITDEDVEDFYENNPDLFEDTDFEDIQEQLKNELIAQEQQVKNEEFIEDLRAQAEIINRYDQIQKKDDFVACIQNKDVKDEIIFVSDDSCQFSNEMVPLVMKLNNQNKSFMTLSVTESESEVFDECVKPLLEDLAVPQFICASSGEVKRGNLPEEELREFVQVCN